MGFESKGKEGHWITVGSKGLNIEFHLCEGFYPLEPGNTGFCFTSEDVVKEEKELEGRGVKFTQPAKKEAWGTSAAFADPDGNEFWMMEE